MTAILQVEVDREVCCGSGNCVLIAPAVFDQDDADGRVLLVERRPVESLHEVVRRAGDACPTRAITIIHA